MWVWGWAPRFPIVTSRIMKLSAHSVLTPTVNLIRVLLLLCQAVRDTVGILSHYFTRLDWLTRRFKRYGADTYPVCILTQPMPAFVTRDPAVVQMVLRDDMSNFEKGELFRDVFGEMLGEGIFNVDGASTWAAGVVSTR